MYIYGVLSILIQVPFFLGVFEKLGKAVISFLLSV